MGCAVGQSRQGPRKPATAGGPGHHHDGHVGQPLKEPGGLGVANSTIVVSTTDNGAKDLQLALRHVRVRHLEAALAGLLQPPDVGEALAGQR
jgi:hypothetical protein